MKKVDDSSTSNFGFKDGSNTEIEYLYDDNGNMTKDMNKGISAITYNHLNLPVLVTMPQDNNTTGTIAYVYDATGVRLQKNFTPMVGGVSGPIITEYANGFIYNNAGSGEMKLQFIAHPEGYVEPVTEIADKVKGFDVGGPGVTYSSYKYVFQYRDHLNNVRLSYSDLNLDGAIDPNTEIIEESNYYPFGLKQKGYNVYISPDGNALAQQWKFGGKEFNQELGLDWYDITARNYDPALGRWMNIDPLAELMRRHSPYNYAFDNPIFWIDPDGREPMVNMGYTDQSLNSITGSVEFSGTFESTPTGGGDSAEPPTEFVNEKGETIANTDDKNDETYVIRKENEDSFVKEMEAMVESKDDLNPEANKNVGDKYGYDINNHSTEVDGAVYKVDINSIRSIQDKIGYDRGFEGKGLADGLSDTQPGSSSKGIGYARGESHRKDGKMNAFNPKTLNTNAKNYIRTNLAPRTNSYKYSPNPIPLLIE